MRRRRRRPGAHALSDALSDPSTLAFPDGRADALPCNAADPVADRGAFAAAITVASAAAPAAAAAAAAALTAVATTGRRLQAVVPVHYL